MTDTERLLTETLLSVWPRCVRCGGRATLRTREPNFRQCWCYSCVRDHGRGGLAEAIEPLAGAVAIDRLELLLAAKRTEK